MKIDPDRLRSLRRKKGLSRPELEERSEISVRTIQRLELEPDRCRTSREDTVNRLAKALDVDAGVLTGELPLPKFDEAPASDPERVQIGAQIAPKVRLAYDLAKRRYGVNITDIINMAPLFFVLLAEGSLAWRREKLEEADSHWQQVSSGHGIFGAALTVAEMESVAEEDSIAKADLFGDHLVDTDEHLGTDYFGGAPFDPAKGNPFANYLCKLTHDLDLPGIIDVEGDNLRYGSLEFPGYDICRDELDRIANGSSNARRALETGCARLSGIPGDLMAEEAGEERAAWLEEKLLDIYKSSKKLAELGATLPSGDKLRKVLENASQTNGENEQEGDSQ